MRALRSYLVISVLFSVACSFDKNDGPCNGCSSPHSRPGYGPYGGSTGRDAQVKKLVLEDGTDIAQYEEFEVNWAGTTFDVIGRPLAIGYDDAADGGVDADADAPDADADVVEAGPAWGATGGNLSSMVARIVISELPTKPGRVVIATKVQVCPSPSTRLIGDVCRDANGVPTAPETFDTEVTYDSTDWANVAVTAHDDRLSLDARIYTTPGTPATPATTECY